MGAKTLIPDPAVITVERIVPDDTDIVLVARTRRCAVPCPVCGQPATRVHSWYTRSLRDLPWQGLAVRMELRTRRWFCDTPAARGASSPNACPPSPPPSASAPPASRPSC